MMQMRSLGKTFGVHEEIEEMTKTGRKNSYKRGQQIMLPDLKLRLVDTRNFFSAQVNI